MISLLQVVVIILQLFLSPMPMAFSSLMSSGFHKLSVPRNALCPTSAFKSISKIECASNCLLKDAYNSCTVFMFDTTQKGTPCTCMHAKCIPYTPDDSPPIDVLISMECDTSNIGKKNSFITHLTYKGLHRVQRHINLEIKFLYKY